MKKTIGILFFMIAMLILCSCSSQQGNGDSSTTDTGNTEEKYITISTPYADLKVPEEFEGNVVNEVTNENPYTLVFKAEKDGTELFSIIFNGKGDILMGTLIDDDKNIVIYMNIPELDSKQTNYDTYCGYQEGVNTIMNQLAKDYDFMIDEIVESEDTTTFDIKTSVVTLKYPDKWKDKVKVDVSDKCVEFYNGKTHLFDISFKKTKDGYLLGAYKDTPIYIVEYYVKKDEHKAMQEDVNVILHNLIEDSNFKIHEE